MKKLLLFFFAIFMLFTGVQNLYPDEQSEAWLKAITDSIPEEWWYGGWNKLGELRDFISENPDDFASCARAQYYIGCNYHSKGKHEEAINEYNLVLSLYPSAAFECARAQYEIAQITLYSFNKPEEAVIGYRKVVEKYPDDAVAPVCQLCIGRAYMKLGNMDQAASELQKVLDNYPSAKTQADEARADLKSINENRGSANTKGVLTFPSGSRYEGELRHNRMNGKGVLVYANGDRYEGEFLDNNFNGKGKHTWTGGGVYEGAYVLNSKEGYGIFSYSNGDIYKGQFKSDLYNGEGTLYLVSLHGGKRVKSGLWYLGQYLGKDEDGSASLLPTREEDLEEEKNVARILNKDNLERIDGMDEIFKFADKLLGEGFAYKAMALYESALTADSTRLDYQLKLAKLELKNGRKEQAATRAGAIYDYAEVDEIISEAKGVLNEAGCAGMADAAGAPRLGPNMEIALIPVGNPDRRIMEETAEIMQKELGFVMKVEQEAVELPADKSRDAGGMALNECVKKILAEMPEEKRDELISGWGGGKDELKTIDGQKRFVRFALKQSGLDDDRISIFMKIFEPNLQYDADSIIECLRKKYDVRAYDKVKGFIGITSVGIYNDDYSNISFSTGNKYAIVSYVNYSGNANYGSQNRKLLVRRLSKAGIDAALSVMHIPHCSTPYCVNSNCDSVERRDTLEPGLCEKCKKDLAGYKS